MFEHLDDPNPPPPRSLLVELVVAEGARRRRRAVIAGGLAASLLVVAGCVRLAQVAGSERGLDVDPAPVNTSPDPRGEGSESGDVISSFAPTMHSPSGAIGAPAKSSISARQLIAGPDMRRALGIVGGDTLLRTYVYASPPRSSRRPWGLVSMSLRLLPSSAGRQAVQRLQPQGELTT